MKICRAEIVLGLLLCGGLAASAPAAETNALPALTLAEAQELAVRQHPQLAAANDLAEAAKSVLTEKRAGLFPQANLYGAAVGAGDASTRIEAGGLNNPSIYDRAAGGVEISQLITDFGHTANLSASARYAAQAETQNAAGTRNEVLLQVEASYLAALEAQAVQRVAQQTLDTRQLLLEQVTTLATNKLRSALDVSFAQVALDEGHLLLQKSQNNADADMAALCTALGLNHFSDFQLVEPVLPAEAITNDIDALVQTALSDRPDLLSLRDRKESSVRLARSARDARLPTISAVGVAGGTPIHDSRLPDNYAAAGLELSLPLFAGGYYSAEQREAEYRSDAEAETLRNAENNVIRDVRLAWLDLTSALEQYQTTESLVKNANEAYQLADARYQSGISSIVELSQAQLALVSAQINAINARYNVLIQQANLAYQTGQAYP